MADTRFEILRDDEGNVKTGLKFAESIPQAEKAILLGDEKDFAMVQDVTPWSRIGNLSRITALAMRCLPPAQFNKWIEDLKRNGARFDGSSNPLYYYYTVDEYGGKSFPSRFLLLPLLGNPDIPCVFNWEGLDPELLREEKSVSRKDQLANLETLMNAGLELPSRTPMDLVQFGWLSGIITDENKMTFCGIIGCTEEEMNKWILDLGKFVTNQYEGMDYCFHQKSAAFLDYRQIALFVKDLPEKQRQEAWIKLVDAYIQMVKEKSSSEAPNLTRALDIADNPEALVKLLSFKAPARSTRRSVGEALIDRGKISALHALLEAGFFKTKKVRGELEEYARVNRKENALHFLENYRLARPDSLKEAGTQKTQEKKGRTADPFSPAAMKKIWNYKEENGRIILTGYKGSMLKVSVPDHIGKLPVTELGDRLFSPKWGRQEYKPVKEMIESVTLPDSIHFIGDEVFQGCDNLTQIVIPESVEVIGSSAFQECRRLSQVVLPASVKRLGSMAFADTILTTVIFCNPDISLPEPYTRPASYYDPGFTTRWQFSTIRRITVQKGSKAAAFFRKNYPEVWLLELEQSELEKLAGYFTRNPGDPLEVLLRETRPQT